jgi:hypothetical protein
MRVYDAVKTFFRLQVLKEAILKEAELLQACAAAEDAARALAVKRSFKVFPQLRPYEPRTTTHQIIAVCDRDEHANCCWPKPCAITGRRP